MHTSWWKILLGLVMVVNGVYFASQVRFFYNASAALRFHGDLPPDVDPSFVDLKVVAWGLAGLAWVVAGIGLMTSRREWLPAAVLALLLVEGLYVAELWLWGVTYPVVWAWFAVFGGLALVYAVVCRQVWRSTAGLA